MNRLLHGDLQDAAGYRVDPRCDLPFSQLTPITIGLLVRVRDPAETRGAIKAIRTAADNNTHGKSVPGPEKVKHE